jgi:hypothetical protein
MYLKIPLIMCNFYAPEMNIFFHRRSTNMFDNILIMDFYHLALNVKSFVIKEANYKQSYILTSIINTNSLVNLLTKVLVN